MMKKLIASAGFVCVGLLLMGFTPKTTVVMNETGQSILEVQKTLPLLQANSLTSVTNPVRYITNISEADINGRFVGMLLHMKWLMNERGDSTNDKEITRLNSQVLSLMDDISEDNRDREEEDEDTLPDMFVISDAGVVTSGSWQASVIADAFLSDTLTIGSGSTFANNLITPNSILTIGQTDEYCLTYETTGTTFEWQTCGAGSLASTDIDTSTELSGILGDETGTGNVVFSASPTLSGILTAANANFSGNVGIGTTSPFAKLSVTNSGSGPSFIVEDSASPDTTPFVITAAGNVGIGLLTPNANSSLHIEQTSTITSSSAEAGRMRMIANPGSNSMGLYNGLAAFAETQGGLPHNINKLTGVYGGAYHEGSGTVSNAYGVWGDIYNDSTGTITNASNFHAEFGGYGGTVTNLKMLDIAILDNPSGIVTNTYGVYVGDITSGTQTNTPYSFYASDSGALNYLAGNVGIGDVTPDALLDFDLISSSASAANQYGSYFTVTDTGVTNAGTDRTYGNRIDVTRTGATGGTLQTYGQYMAVNGDTGGASTNYGLYMDVTGADSNYGLYVDVTGAGTNYAAIFDGGNVGIGTTTPAQELQVFGDIRVGTTGTNGCLEDFGGGVIAGTCSSDERLKENITPIAEEGRSYLEALAALTPVTYNWNKRAAELYSKNGSVENLGLIAQDVEAVFPELVSLNDDGYRQVDFRALPFYIMEALKELWQKVQGHDERIETLEKENDYLKERIETIEDDLNIEPAPAPVVEEVVADESESQPSESPAEATETDVVEDTSLDTIQEEMVAEPEAEPTYVLVPVAQ